MNNRRPIHFQPIRQENQAPFQRVVLAYQEDSRWDRISEERRGPAMNSWHQGIWNFANSASVITSMQQAMMIPYVGGELARVMFPALPDFTRLLNATRRQQQQWYQQQQQQQQQQLQQNFTDTEVACLVDGVDRYGVGSWMEIRAHHSVLLHRSDQELQNFVEGNQDLF